MDHNLFKPNSFIEAQNAVVGNCNGFTMQERWDKETPLFAKAILAHAPRKSKVLDYGCGVGRLAKEVLTQNPEILIDCLDASTDMLKQAAEYIGKEGVGFYTPGQFDAQAEDNPFMKYNLIYCVYVLQHCPAIEIREVLSRIYNALEDNGTFVYCSSDYRMAIRFDGKGFFDDRFLGVNLQEEIERFFDYQGELFSEEDYAANPVINEMVRNGLQHPAKVYRKKAVPPRLVDAPIAEVKDYSNDAYVAERIKEVSPTLVRSRHEMLGELQDACGITEEIIAEVVIPHPKYTNKLVFVNDLSPGDILLTSIAIRSLHRAFPGRFITDMRSPCNELFTNNPYITHITDPDRIKASGIIEKLKKDDTLGPIILGDVTYIIAHYPEIHRSGMTGLPFMDGHRMFIEHQLDLAIPRTGMFPDIFLNPDEINKFFDQFKEVAYKKFWVINAGSKSDYTLKQYHRYQAVIDLMPDITFVQVGHEAHSHPALKNVIDMRGMTTLRGVAILINASEGVLTPISLTMHMAAAFQKPCVVVAGAREGTRWELYPNHRYLNYNGSMSCSNANGDGCWKSKIEECTNKTEDGHAMCMEMITPVEITNAIRSYYKGGRLSKDRLPENVKIAREAVDRSIKDVALAKEVADNEARILTLPQAAGSVMPTGTPYTTPQISSAVMNILRILKGVTPEDSWYDNYLWHYNKRGDSFMDTYHFMHYLGAIVKPKRILEIGSRSGVSICQLLSAYIDLGAISRIVLCDLFNDGLCTPQLIMKHLQHLNLYQQLTTPIQFIEGDSRVEIPKLLEFFDYILVDGSHDKPDAILDLYNVVPLCATGGYIVFDDIAEDGCSLDDVWQDFKSKYEGVFDFWEDYNGKGIGFACRK